ncbi:MAG: hypothetical protein JWO06_1142 [Bacteroidota bacterium]|nr:hypothetical protein [Bacteroidota bacterium]
MTFAEPQNYQPDLLPVAFKPIPGLILKIPHLGDKVAGLFGLLLSVLQSLKPCI